MRRSFNIKGCRRVASSAGRATRHDEGGGYIQFDVDDLRGSPIFSAIWRDSVGQGRVPDWAHVFSHGDFQMSMTRTDAGDMHVR